MRLPEFADLDEDSQVTGPVRHQVKLEVVARRNFEIDNVKPASMGAGRQ
jgi:hypothetical protein